MNRQQHVSAELDEARALIRECDALLELLPTRSDSEQREYLPLITATRAFAVRRELTLQNAVQKHYRGGTVRGATISMDARSLRERIQKAHAAAIAADDPLTHEQLRKRFDLKSTKTIQRARKAGRTKTR